MHVLIKAHAHSSPETYSWTVLIRSANCALFSVVGPSGSGADYQNPRGDFAPPGWTSGTNRRPTDHLRPVSIRFGTASIERALFLLSRVGVPGAYVTTRAMLPMVEGCEPVLGHTAAHFHATRRTDGIRHHRMEPYPPSFRQGPYTRSVYGRGPFHLPRTLWPRLRMSLFSMAVSR